MRGKATFVTPLLYKVIVVLADTVFPARSEAVTTTPHTPEPSREIEPDHEPSACPVRNKLRVTPVAPFVKSTPK